MDNIKLICKILLVIIIGLTLWQIIAFFSRDQTVIERAEGNEMPTLISSHPTTNMNEGLTSTAGYACNSEGYDTPSNNINFYVRGNRFATCNKGNNTGYTMPAPSENLCNLNLPGSWTVPHKAGANNTTSDLLWHKMEPRMILQDIGMNCKECGPYTDYNSPQGVASDYTSSLTGNHELGGAIQSNTGFGGLNPVIGNMHTKDRIINSTCTGQPFLPQSSCLDDKLCADCPKINIVNMSGCN